MESFASSRVVVNSPAGSHRLKFSCGPLGDGGCSGPAIFGRLFWAGSVACNRDEKR